MFKIEKGIFSELSTRAQLSFFIVISLISLLIFMFFGFLVSSAVTGIGLNNSILTNFENPSTITYHKIGQVSQALGFFIIPSLVAAFLFQKNNENFLQFRTTKIYFLLLAGLLMLFSLPLINSFAELNQKLSLPIFLSNVENWMRSSELRAKEVTVFFLKADNIWTLISNIFIMALLPAIGEEMLFRGVLQQYFSKLTRNIHLGIWITAFIFSAIHMQFFTFLPRFFMGALFGYMLVWSGSIWLPITAHFINNGLAVVLNYLVQKGTVDSNIETLGSNGISSITISTILVLSLLYVLYSGRLSLSKS